MSSEGSELKFVAYAWRSSASFDQFENVFPVMTGVSEILINSAAGGALVMSESLATVGLSVATGGSGGLAWAEVWKMSVGSGVYSMAGQRIQLSEKQDVEGVRLTSSVGGSAHSGSGVFEGWSEVVFHFGVATSAGAVKVASGTIELGAGTSASVSSESVSISAAAEIAISAGEVEFASEVISVQASAGAAIEADRLSLVSAGALDVVSGGSLAGTVDSASINLQTGAALASGGSITATAASATAVFTEASLLSSSADMMVGATIEAVRERNTVSSLALLRPFCQRLMPLLVVLQVVGGSASLLTHDVTVDASGSLEGFAGGGLELTAGGGGVSASGGQASLTSVGHEIRMPAGEAATVRSLGALDIEAQDVSACIRLRCALLCLLHLLRPISC